MVRTIMLICYNGEVKEVTQKGGGCSVCKQSSNGKKSLEFVREADYFLANGQKVHFVKGQSKRLSESDGLALIGLTYTLDGVTYDKFTVVGS